jgi:hypothetical protein
MVVDYKKLTEVILAQIWPRFIQLTKQYRQDNNLTRDPTEVDWEAVTKPGLFTIGLFFISALLKNNANQETVTFYISIAAQNIDLRLEFNSSVRTLKDASTFTPTLTSSHRFNETSLENMKSDWKKWLTWAEKENTIPKTIELV